jgi:hypothetical protein
MTQTTGSLAGAANSVRPSDSETVAVSKSNDLDEKSDESARAKSTQGSTAELGALLLGLLFGGLGFVVHFFWIPAMVVMAVVFGLLLASRRASRTTRSLVPELIATTVHGARDIIDAASTKDSSENDVDDADQPGDESERARPDGDDDHTQSKRHANGHLTVVDMKAPPDTAPSNGNAGSPSATPDRNGIINVVAADVQSHLTSPAPSVHAKEQESEDAEVFIEVGVAEPAHDLPAQESSKSKTTVSAVGLPIRVFVSADRLAAHNALLRPVRKHFLQVATALSQTIVQLASTPPTHSEPSSEMESRAKEESGQPRSKTDR